MFDQRRFTTTATLAVIMSASLLNLWLAYMADVGLLVAWIGLVFNATFGYFLWKGARFARYCILGRYLLTVGWALVITFVLRDPLGGLFEGLVALSVIALLIGRPSRHRLIVALAGYVVVLLALGLLLVQVARDRRERLDILAVAESVPQYQSSFKYTVAMGKQPWKVLSNGQARTLIGNDVDNADLRLVRQDGSAFALFFPLQFSNTQYSEQVSRVLEKEIRENWLSNLKGWRRHELEEGFILTAQGKDGVSYVVFYKHFGNMGVYSVFWGERRNRRRLLSEAEKFYEQLDAPPVKDRMEVLTPAQIYQENNDAVVLINVYDGNRRLVGKGSGFNIASEGLIITNLHVILSGRYLEVVFPKQGAFQDVVVAGLTQPEVDLALLALPRENLPKVKGFKSVSVAPGDQVYVLGNPKGLTNSISAGIIGAVRDGGELTLYQITAPISKGSSGGPVFNAFGEVIGVANAVVVDAQNLNFSISIDEVKQLMLLEEPMTLDQLMTLLEEK